MLSYGHWFAVTLTFKHYKKRLGPSSETPPENIMIITQSVSHEHGTSGCGCGGGGRDEPWIQQELVWM